MSTTTRTEEEITTCLMAMIAWAGNASAASRYLKAEKGISVSSATLGKWKQLHGDRYDELRERYSAQLESNLVHELRDVARLSVETQRLAIQKAQDLLNKGEDRDPARSAANLARVTQSSVDKSLSLSGRPTQITETRDIGQILRSLAAKGVLELPAGEEEPESESVR